MRLKLRASVLLSQLLLLRATGSGNRDLTHQRLRSKQLGGINSESVVLRKALSEIGSEDGTFEWAGLLNLDFNTAYVSFHEFNSGPGLAVSSFHNVALNPHANSMMGSGNTTGGGPPFIPFEDDLVALVTSLDADEPSVTRLTFKNSSIHTTWPNEVQRSPDGVFPFEAVVVPQGWFAQPAPGGLFAVDVNTEQVVVIHQSTADMPRFYHSVVFVDMNQDGNLDILTARSGYKVIPSFHPPTGELVWFENPGLDSMGFSVENTTGVWKEHILVDDLGPDVFVDAKDMDGDGVPEIVATHFFAGLPEFVGTDWESESRVTLYGAPQGEDWTAVDLSATPAKEPRSAVIIQDQGSIFSVEIVDLDGDGRLDVLSTNHQSLFGPIDGRVLGVEPPTSGLLFDDPWIVHTLMGGIRPTSPPPGHPPIQLAPGSAKTFRVPSSTVDTRPWIAVSGDEAGKAWVLKATPEPWVYEPETLLDINEYYGENTTQTLLEDPYGISISTIGSIGIRQEEDEVILYVPVFEATDIHVFSSIVDAFEYDTPEESVSSSSDDGSSDVKKMSIAPAVGMALVCVLVALA